jgi:hypothetical protein
MPLAGFEPAIPASEGTQTYTETGMCITHFQQTTKLFRYQSPARLPNVTCTTQCSNNVITQKKILGLQVMMLFRLFNDAFKARRSFST